MARGAGNVCRGLTAMSVRMVAAVEYDGTPFFGWQRQRQSPTVQAELEAALSKVAAHPVEVYASGRTDTGVHAWRQVVHFDVHSVRSKRSWLLGTQTHLMPGIALVWVQPVDADFHARYCAVARQYQYRIVNRIHRPAIDRDRALWVHQPLNDQCMHHAAQALVGEHDFSSFRAAGCQAKHSMRCVNAVSVARTGDEITVDIEANAFLYHMVRNIVGSLLLIGRGERDVDWLQALLLTKDRTHSGMTAPPHGLYFMRALYPRSWALPDEVTVQEPL